MLAARDLARWWVRGVVNPAAAMRALPGTGWPKAGLVVVTRFTVQDVVQTLPLALLGRPPFMPAKLPIRPEHHYRVTGFRRLAVACAPMCDSHQVPDAPSLLRTVAATVTLVENRSKGGEAKTGESIILALA